MKNQRLVSSKLLDRKWREQEQMIHKRKLREVQSAIRTQQVKPYAPTITMRNAKKEAMLESKYARRAEIISTSPTGVPDLLTLSDCLCRALYGD